MRRSALVVALASGLLLLACMKGESGTLATNSAVAVSPPDTATVLDTPVVAVSPAPIVPTNTKDSSGFWYPTPAISGLQLGMSRAAVIGMVGHPSRIEAHSLESLGIPDSSYALEYPFGEVKLYGDRVEYVTCIAATCTTSEGLRVGSPIDSVAILYGPAASRGETGNRWFLYPDPRSDCGMTVRHDEVKVVGLFLWCDNS